MPWFETIVGALIGTALAWVFILGPLYYFGIYRKFFRR